MADLTPNNREEHWLQGMADGQTDLTPNKRREYWYKEIVDAIGSGGGGGTGGGVYVVNVSITEKETTAEYTCDKTAGEILSALKTSLVLFVVENGYVCVVVNGGPKLDGYSFLTIGAIANMEYNCINSDEYPFYVDHF